MTVALAVTERGSGRPLVILHGLFGSGRNWATIADKLGDMHRVLAVDLRNHGASPWAEAMTFGAMAADVRALIDDEGIAPAAVMGHSMGGKVAMRLALESPERVERLIVVDIAPVPNPPTLLGYVRAMRALDLSQVKRRADAERALSTAVPNAAERAFLVQNLTPDDAGGLRWRLNLAAIEASFGDILDWPAVPPGKVYAGPTLFVSGARSSYVRPEDHDLIRGLFPAARFEVIPNAGHWVHAEQQAAFLNVVRNFLRPT